MESLCRWHGRTHVVAAVCLAALVPVLAGCPSTKPQAAESPGETALSATPQGTTGQSYFLYQVRRGDTLYSLSRRFRVTADEISKDNNISSPREMAVGTLLMVRRVEGVDLAALASGASEGGSEPEAAAQRAVAQSELYRGSPGAQFWWPTAGTLTRRFGDQFRGLSDPGIAISAPAGTEVYAVADGTVSSVVRGGDAPDSVWGNVVSITHAGGVVSWYAHLANILVREGARVSKGEAIGTVGSTGKAPAPMLAFRIYRNARPVDPLVQLP